MHKEEHSYRTDSDHFREKELLGEGMLVNGGLVLVGLFGVIVGAFFLFYGIKGDVSADTKWGKFSGTVGAVSVIFGLTLMAFGVI